MSRSPKKTGLNYAAVIVLALLVGLVGSCEQKQESLSSIELPDPRIPFTGPEDRAPVIQKGATLKSYPVAGTVVAGSRKCRDCESVYAVHDGKGSQLRRAELNSEECCPCGSTQKFRDGNRYQIRCENGRIIARML